MRGIGPFTIPWVKRKKGEPNRLEARLQIARFEELSADDCLSFDRPAHA
jgi:hypothetical protein